MQNRKGQEENFFDRWAARDPRGAKIYGQVEELDFQRAFNEYFESRLPEVDGKPVLEYGCGNYGDMSSRLARQGARVTAGDISGESVRSARERLTALGLGGQVQFLKMDCERLSFKTGIFDLVVGRAILHHLDLEQAIPEIRRVLKPGGRAIFIEPLGYNPLLNLYRRLTPGEHTPGEHPLKGKDFAIIGRHFSRVAHREFNLCPMPLIFLAQFVKNKTRLVGLLNRLEALDQFLFAHFPLLGKLAWTTVITLE